MKELLMLILVIMVTWCCNNVQNLHPFDKDFSLEIINKSSKLNTQYHTCGYYTVLESFNNYQIYYDGYFHTDKFIGKGLKLFIDSINMNKNLDYASNFKLLNDMAFDTSKIDKVMSLFNYERMKSQSNSDVVISYTNSKFQIDFYNENPFNGKVQRYLITRNTNPNSIF